MEAIRLFDKEDEWDRDLLTSYRNQEKRTGTHVSDLTWCLRQSALSRLHDPEWEPVTLYRFTMGRAMEHSFFSQIMPESTQELEVEQDGIVGHIDFADDPTDYECKLTWGKEPEDDNVQGWFEDSKSYWLEQAGAYTYMRNRTEINFVVCFVNYVPRIRSYRIQWTHGELADLWRRFQDSKEYLDFKEVQGELPMRTIDTKKCKTCQFKRVCDASGA
tara:strand:+ start:692 stop:1342 length:651 start_codon:yes stop_codon:yes gene_type:complete